MDTSSLHSHVVQLFEQNNVSFPSKQIYLRAFKKEKIIELYASNNGEYVLIKKYKFTATSGKLGPKQKEGDRQIPEGFYKINAFNPKSKFHLSFRINYPNHADSIRNKSEVNLGGDIYIHGGKSTVGCIPIGDKQVEELYYICSQSYLVNPEIPVHIFPFKMNTHQLQIMKRAFSNNAQLWKFWDHLQIMYRFFESHKMLGEITGVDDDGNYILSIPWD